MRGIPHLIPYLVISVLLVTLLSLILPFTMDEFSQFSPIICHYYPYNALNVFREACGLYDLRIPLPVLNNMHLPLRAFYYVGSVQALIYFPLFLLWKSPLSARLLGMIWLIAEASVLSILFPGIRRRWFFFGLIGFFFYFLMHVVDRGPIGPQFFFAFLSYWLICQWINTLRLRYVVWLVIITVAGLWLKLSFIWIMVGVAMVSTSYFLQRWRMVFATPQSTRKFLWQAAVGLLVLALLWYVIFFAQMNDGVRYYKIMGLEGMLSWKELLQGEVFSSHSWGILWNMWHANALGKWEQILPPTAQSIAYTLVTILSLPILALGLMATRRLTIRQIIEPAVFYAAFLVVLSLILLSKTAWAIHHIMLAFPFLILSFASLFDACRHSMRKMWAGWYVVGCMLLAVNGIAYATYFRQPIRVGDSFSRQVMHEVLYDHTLSSRYIYVIVDFGMYFYQGLYGNRDQSVLFILPLNKAEQIAQLKEIALAQHRKLLFVHQTGWSETNKELIASSFDLQRCSAVPADAVWQILLEKDGSIDSPCHTTHPAVQAPAERSLSTILW
ncbi:MAG: hypothetical protein Q7S29_02670 [Candidatus Peribacter sp.]|nr:hypothetical protein [Candidatus Peribacter sp.]